MEGLERRNQLVAAQAGEAVVVEARVVVAVEGQASGIGAIEPGDQVEVDLPTPIRRRWATYSPARRVRADVPQDRTAIEAARGLAISSMAGKFSWSRIAESPWPARPYSSLRQSRRVSFLESWFPPCPEQRQDGAGDEDEADAEDEPEFAHARLPSLQDAEEFEIGEDALSSA